MRLASLTAVVRALALVVALVILAGPPWGMLRPSVDRPSATVGAGDSLATPSLLAVGPTPADPPSVPSASSTGALITALPTTTASPTSASVPAGELYGSGVGADSLGNTQIGGTNVSPSARLSFRFRAHQSAPLESVRFYLQDGSGYSSGSGGTLEVTIQTDRGGSAHIPSGVVLARESFRPGNPIQTHLRSLGFSTPPKLVAGSLYHVVFRNTDANPRSNYVSVNSLVVLGPSPEDGQPRYAESDWGEVAFNGSTWARRPNHTPILAVQYTNGASEGLGYMEVWVREPRLISGPAAVRQTFTVSDRPRTATFVRVRLARDHGADPLMVRLETADGAVIDAASVPAETLGGDPSWMIAVLPSRPVLAAGQAYHLVLSAAAATQYSAFAIRKGVAYGFPATTYFADGSAEYTTDGRWHGFDQPGGTRDSPEADLQFYFG